MIVMDFPHHRALMSFYQPITNDQTWPPHSWKMSPNPEQERLCQNYWRACQDWRVTGRSASKSEGLTDGSGIKSTCCLPKDWRSSQHPHQAAHNQTPTHVAHTHIHTYTCINKNKSFFLVWDLPEKVIIYMLSFSSLRLSELNICEVL